MLGAGHRGEALIRIVVSYRRADSAAITGRIVDRLIARYGAAAVFIDVDNIPLGVDFRSHIQEVLSHTDVFLAVIGPHWFGEREGGAERLQEPEDPVRVEVETALRNQTPIIPVLVEGSGMPSRARLPETLAPLHFLNAATVASGIDFHVHTNRLIGAIDQLLERKYGAAPPRPDAPGAAAVKPVRPDLQQLAIGLAPVAAILALPFAAAFGVMTPPWPRAAAPITAIIEVLAVLIVYQVAKGRSRGIVRWLMIISSVLAIGAGGGYAAAVSLYTYQTPKADRLLAKGLECTKDAQLVYKDKCPALGPDELAGAEYEAGYLWTSGSIGLVEASLAGLWFTGFIAISVLAASFLAHRVQGPRPAG